MSDDKKELADTVATSVHQWFVDIGYNAYDDADLVLFVHETVLELAADHDRQVAEKARREVIEEAAKAIDRLPVWFGVQAGIRAIRSLIPTTPTTPKELS